MNQRLTQWTIALLLVFAIIWPNGAMAQSFPPSATFHWIITVDWLNGKTKANLVLQEWIADQLNQEILIDFSKSCQVIGTVSITKAGAKFNGKGYIKCMVPSVAQTITNYFGVTVPASAISQAVWISPELRGQVKGPIIAYDTIQFEAEFASDVRSSKVTLDGTPYQQAYSGHVYGLPGQTYRLWVGQRPWLLLDYLYIWAKHWAGQSAGHWAGQWAAPYFNLPFIAPGAYSTRNLFYLDDNDWQKTGQSVAPYAITTDKTPLYIGFDPVTGQHLKGTLVDVGIDPNVRGDK